MNTNFRLVSYVQIIRWFQNHAYLDRKSCGEVKPKKNKGSPPPVDDEDAEAVKLHLDHLDKELKKGHPDADKVTTLLSLIYMNRRATMLEHSAETRTLILLQLFGCFKRPRFVSANT